jgi:aspartate racemase
LGIIGGLGALAGADILFKIIKTSSLRETNQKFDVLFEQEPFDDRSLDEAGGSRLTERKLYVYRVVRELEARQVDTVVLPCFISHTFLHEIAPELKTQIVDIMAALSTHISANYPTVRKLGVISSAHVRECRLFETSPGFEDYQILYPDSDIQDPGLREAVYGPKGIKAGHLSGDPIDHFQRACDDLVQQGAEIIVPGLTELPLVQDALALPPGVTIIDCNQVYADFALRSEVNERVPEYKIGIIGGVGPLATVDFMDKVIRHTEASKDQDHIKMVVEHNPKIPDRTENLLSDGPDPTIPLLAACKRLEADNAEMIAIPCNTAHAFVERIQRYISIPVVHMLYETACTIRDNYPRCKTVGLLATTGTLQSRVYHDVLEAMDLQVLVPDDEHQDRVMAAIYGEEGVKAGFTTGSCVDDLQTALASLVVKGADAVILGCTELPILLQASDEYSVEDRSVIVLDPTEILARRCVAFAQYGVL